MGTHLFGSPCKSLYNLQHTYTAFGELDQRHIYDVIFSLQTNVLATFLTQHAYSGPRSSGWARGAVKQLRAMETYKKILTCIFYLLYK